MMACNRSKRVADCNVLIIELHTDIAHLFGYNIRYKWLILLSELVIRDGFKV
jgi:hypothetical protein